MAAALDEYHLLHGEHLRVAVERVYGSFYSRIVRISGFRPGENNLRRAFAAIAVDAQPHMQEIFETGMAFHIKAVLTWFVHYPSDLPGRTSLFYMNVVPFRFSEGARGSYGDKLRAMLAELRRRSEQLIEGLRMRKTGATFLGLARVEIFLVPGRRLQTASARLRGLVVLGGTYVKLPPALERKKCCLNIQNRDTQCFQLCIVAWELRLWEQTPDDNPTKASYYQARSDGRPVRPGKLPPGVRLVPKPLEGIDFSMLDPARRVDLEGIDLWEERNQYHVHVFEWIEVSNGGEPGAERVCFPHKIRSPIPDVKGTRGEVVLLLYRGHFVLVKDFHKLMNHRRGPSIEASTRTGTRFCHRCLQHFRSAERYEHHMAECNREDLVVTEERRVVLPEPDETGNPPEVDFTRFECVLEQPAVVYADFETYCLPETGVRRGCELLASNARAASFAYAVVGRAGYEPPEGHRLCMGVDGDQLQGDVVEQFLIRLSELYLDYLNASKRFENVRDMRITPEQQEQHRDAEECYLCGASFGYVEKVRDHNHFDGRYRGAACPQCNGKARVSKTIPVLLHNLGGFDGNLLLQGIARLRNPELYPESYSKFRLSIIQKTGEKMSCIRFGGLSFVDSLSFQGFSLEKLIASQRRAREPLPAAFPILAERHPALRGRGGADGADVESLDLLLRKVPFPYSSMRDRGCFDGPAVLPREAYDNDLQEEPCTEEKHELVRRVVAHFGLRSFRSYHDLYLATDVLALADIMEAFRAAFRVSMKQDPLHQITLPGAAYQAMLQATRPRLQLICSSNGGWEFMQDVNNNVRGGVSCIFQPFAQSNNVKVPGFDPSRPCTWITYLDVNSLYPKCMTYPLPVGDYEKVGLAEEEGERLELLHGILRAYDDEDEQGFLCVVDFEIPERYHDELDFPPVARMAVTERSEHHEVLREAYNKTHEKPSEKLVPFLGPQREVGVHVALLKFYVEKMHVRVTRVHRVWRWTQRAFMRHFIERMAESRARSRDPVERSIIKLVMNSLYGKYLQNKEGYREVLLKTSATDWERAAVRLNATDWDVVVNEEDGTFLGKVQVKRGGQVVLDTARLVGFTILELSKREVLRFHYGVIKAKYGKRATLLATDTDSLFHKLETPDLVADLAEMREHLDLAASFPDIAEPGNAGKLGKLKDEFEGLYCGRFVGIGSKMYATESFDEQMRPHYIKKGKGVPSALLRARRSFEDYLRQLDEPAPDPITFRRIRSFAHRPMQIVMTKSALCGYNDKVFLLGPRHARPHGHWRNRQVIEPEATASASGATASASGASSDPSLPSSLQAQWRQRAIDERVEREAQLGACLALCDGEV